MSEQEYLQRIRKLLRNPKKNAVTAISLIEKALHVYPKSAVLWTLRGNVIEMQPNQKVYPLAMARECYIKATRIDPQNGDAFNELGYYLDCIRNRPDLAEQWFRKAVKRNTGIDSYLGLARCLAQIGKRAKALRILEDLINKNPKNMESRNLLTEIKSGLWG